MATHYQVIQDYAGPYSDPINLISFDEGETLMREYTDDQHPGWWWCTDKRDKSGWVHESFFYEDDYRYIANQDYSAVELDVKAGDPLTGLREVGGWLLAQTAAGAQGWVPLANVKPISE